MRVTSSPTIIEPAVIIKRETDELLVLREGLVEPEVVLYLDKILSS